MDVYNIRNESQACHCSRERENTEGHRLGHHEQTALPVMGKKSQVTSVTAFNWSDRLRTTTSRFCI